MWLLTYDRIYLMRLLTLLFKLNYNARNFSIRRTPPGTWTRASRKGGALPDSLGNFWTLGLQGITMRKELFTPHFFKRTTIVDASTGCWLYKGYRQTCGYGQLYVEGRRILAHRMSWIAHKGEIPAGMLVCHTCDTPRCVNPEHLFLGTHKDYSDDCVS